MEICITLLQGCLLEPPEAGAGSLQQAGRVQYAGFSVTTVRLKRKKLRQRTEEDNPVMFLIAFTSLICFGLTR